jgi:LDH2 family malate/lactate/ureidoglycolate dehydrogenase
MSRGDVMIAARDGRNVAEGVGLDEAGQPTIDAAEILKGAMDSMTATVAEPALYRHARQEFRGADKQREGRVVSIRYQNGEPVKPDLAK